MGIYLYDQLINLNITRIGKKIIEQDIIIFKVESADTFNGFINYLISTYLEFEDNELEIDLELVKLKDKGEAKPFRINQENFNNLQVYNHSLDGEEIVIGKSAPLFIKAIIENYVRQPFIKRESIIYHNLFNKCALFTKKNNLVQIITKELNTEIIIKPLLLVPSKENSFTYLVGIDCENKEKRIRLSEIKSIKKLSQTKSTNSTDLVKLKEKIVEFGPTFIGEPIVTVKVRLTERGILEYETSIIRRPIHKKIEDGNVYVFECSEKQAQYFFLRFSSDAYIIEPLSLREKLIKIYQDGVDSYKIK